MTAAARSAATLGVLCLILVVGAWWGWGALTEPLPGSEEDPLCSDVTVAAGERVTTDQVVISVYNGTARTGLASATMEGLVERGFVEAETGDAPARIEGGVQIWSDEPDNAAVRLVQRQFRGATVVSGEEVGRGIVVVVGPAFQQLGDREVRRVRARVDSTFCSPPEI